jgi:hypothetical protein
MYPGGPYTYGTYPGYYAPPPGYGAPPGTIVTPGPGYPQPQLGPAVNPTPAWTPSPSPTPASPQLSPTPVPSTPPGSGGFNDGPPTTFNNSGARKPTDIQVPLPVERDPGPDFSPGPGPGPAPGPGPKPNSNNSSFGDPSGKPSFDQGAQLTIPQRLDGPVQSVATVDPQTFESPVDTERRDRDGLVTVAGKAGMNSFTRGGDPCAYDSVGFTWLRGIVDFDRRDGSWHIIYSQHPDAHDRFGGAIRLVDTPKLSTLHDGDIVYVEGRIDSDHRDSRGKPQYRIEGDQIARLGRAPATQSMGN